SSASLKAAARALAVGQRASGSFAIAVPMSVERSRQIGAHAGECRRQLVKMRAENEVIGLARVRRSAYKTVEEHAAEGVDVRAPVQRFALDLLRGGIVDGAEERARLGHPLRTRALREAQVAEVCM